MIEWKTLQIYLAVFAVVSLFGWYLKLVSDMIVLAHIMIIGVLFLYYEYFVSRRFPVLVPMFINRSGRPSFKLDRAGRFRDENKVEYYKLRDTKKLLKVPAFKNLIETTKGIVLPLFSPSVDEYRELEITPEGKVSLMEEDMKTWYKYSIKKAYSEWAQKLSTWQLYQPIVGIAVLGGIVIVVLYIITGGLVEWQQTIVSTTNTITGAVNNLASVSLTPGH